MAAESIFVNGKVYTGSKALGTQEAFAVGGGRFLAVGSSGQILRRKGPSTDVHDLNGRTVLPGLADAHGHFLGLGLLDVIANVTGTTSPEQILSKVAAAAAKGGRDEWITGRGWDHSDWPVKRNPDKAMLDKAVSGRPVFLCRIDGHAGWANSKALEIAGVTAATPDPEGGKILRDERGEPTGVLVDHAMDLVSRCIPEPDRAVKKEAARSAIRKCLSVGMTMAHDMGVGAETLGIYEELISAGEFPFRLAAMIEWRGKDRDMLMAKGPRNAWRDRLWVRGVKIYADGALGSSGAALLEPYADDPGNVGLMMAGEEELRASIEAAVANGFQPVVHVIGDRGCRVVTDIFETVVKSNPGADIRPRMEHAQVVTPEDIRRCARIGVIASMQAIHATADMGWAVNRLGPARARYSYALGEFLRAGALVVSGSDFPIESENPFWGIHAAVTRQDHSGRPEGGWYPENRLTLEEAIESFTIAAAKAAFAEEVLGTIEKGKFADFVVLDRDIFGIPERDLFRVLPVMTVVGGEVVFRTR